MGRRIFVVTDIVIKNVNTVRRMNPIVIHAELSMKNLASSKLGEFIKRYSILQNIAADVIKVTS
jgi:hypothetical protein